MHRRTLLTGVMALAVSQAACQGRPPQQLRTSILKGTVPPQLVKGFRQTLPDGVQFHSDLANTDQDLFQTLQRLRQPPTAGGWRWPWAADPQTQRPNWVSLGDYWLGSAIEQGLVQPLRPTGITQLSSLDPQWSPLVRRTAQGISNPQAPLWGVPYRWGCLVMAYSRRPFQPLGWEPQAWSDLWRPELQGRVILPNHPRTVLGLVLQSLGANVNHPDPQSLPPLAPALTALRSQVMAYASSHYLEPLIREDAWVAVGWSTDVRPVLESYRQLAATVPDPGTVLTADLWVRPAPVGQASGSAPLSLSDQRWLDYWLQPEITVPMSLASSGLSPRLLGAAAPQQLDGDIDATALLVPSREQMGASDFLLPLAAESVQHYQTLWRQLRGRE